jgi:hypothetical protein
VVSLFAFVPLWAGSRVMAWLLAVIADHLRLSLLAVVVLLFILSVACLVGPLVYRGST